MKDEKRRTDKKRIAMLLVALAGLWVSSNLFGYTLPLNAIGFGNANQVRIGLYSVAEESDALPADCEIDCDPTVTG